MEEEILMSYIAGILDGDGSFTLAKLRNASKSPLYFPLIQFGSHRVNLLFLLKEKLGGAIIPAPGGIYSMPFFTWRLRSQKPCIEALKKVTKYLVTKKDRAQYLLDFCLNFKFVRGYALDKDTLFEREKSYLKMGQFNDSIQFKGITTTHRPTKNDEDPLFWAYIAGIMDTDASFSVKKQKYQYGVRYMPALSIDMVDPKTIDYISSKCTYGMVNIIKQVACTNGICYRLSIGKKDEVLEFIEKILPYLKVKNEQAKTVYEFCLNSKNTKSCRLGVPEKEMNFREECHQKVKQLNKYGIYKPSVIDSEALELGNEGQAGNVQAERLTPMDSQECVIV